MTMLSWFRKGKNAGGGYRKDRPPEDDCCPICFDDFHVPCRTDCGHWFCGGCLLRLSRSLAYFDLFKCPMCESLIYKLVPHSPVLIQPGREEVDEILGEIEQYNSGNKSGRELDEILAEIEQYDREIEVRRFRFFMFVLQIDENLLWLLSELADAMLATMWLIILLTQSVYAIEDFCLWPNEGIEFRLFQMLRCALLVLGIWLSRRHMRWDRIDAFI
ncbi:RING-type E3 ubiquitin transferase [Salvia divinorum]|uniref:RING-type E3 ubiquitin transferase n=1 Tax=Salvia divinorum TaxID=28513 RepID=A0ABD1GD85_SALDI